MPDPVTKRLLIGVLVSLLIHAFVLSLQFGIPGLGLPGIEMPWEKRRAPTPPLSIQIVNALPAAQSPASPPLQSLPATDVPVPPLPSSSQQALVTPLPVSAIQLVAPAIPKPVPVPTKSITVKNKTATKKIARLPAPLTPPVPSANAIPSTTEDLPENPPRIIAQDEMRDDSFVVPLPSPEEPERKSTPKLELKPKPEKQSEPVKLADLPEAPDPALQQAAEAAKLAKLADEKKQAELIQQEIVQQKKLKEEMRQLAETQVQQQQQKFATKKLEEDNRQLAEEVTRKQNEKLAEQAAKQAAALALQKQQLEEQSKRTELAQQLRQDELKRQQQEAMRLDLARRQDEDSKQKQALDLQLRKQAEELAQQQAIAIARQKQIEKQMEKQAEELALRQKLEKQAEELVVRQKAEEQARQLAEALAQKERERIAQAAQVTQATQAAQASSGQAKFEPRTLAPLGNNASDRSGDRSGDSLAGAGNDKSADKGIVLPKNLLSSDLASRALDQARGLDLLRGNPPVPRSTEDMSKSRRRSFLGSEDKEFPVRMYVESWRQKIERNGNLNYSQVAKDKARGDPVVTVIIRSDGSVEDVVINRSSGRADLDEAVRRIVRVNARYAAFPPNIALKYDVIEIRRVWNFDETLKILEEMR
ncbi:TonB family protein [Undibacterium sp. Rencai35W]|uniref:TonB family protein n=1 Tax=Undibacterium sp. Rencai35W TaxID=3413046 RepID=UPI003BF075AC